MRRLSMRLFLVILVPSLSRDEERVATT